MFHGKVSDDIAKGLLALQRRIERSQIPSSKIDETLNIATWNIREFGKAPRSDAAIHYIAEILGQFDLIGLVELRDNLADLGRVLNILGPYWRAVYSDMVPDAGGNRERIAYIYDKRAVVFNGLAAEAQPPRTKQGTEYFEKISWWRSPYLASFRAGNFDFIVFTTHVRWGDSHKARVAELESIADWIQERRQEKSVEDKDIIVMGDFNIPARGDAFFKAITKHGLQIPKGLVGVNFGSNLEKDKRYDQILHYATYDNFCNHGGVLDFFGSEAGIRELFPAGMTKDKFTFQLSDHLPLWIQVGTDITGQQLEQILRG